VLFRLDADSVAVLQDLATTDEIDHSFEQFLIGL
jgi:hypothetical protein